MQIDPGVCNSSRKFDVEDQFYMRDADIAECIKTIKSKNCEGYNRIPQKILSDGAEVLVNPISGLL